MNCRAVYIVPLIFSVVRTVILYNITRGTCSEGNLMCQGGETWRSGTTGQKCFHKNHFCDKEMDCSDGSDEKYCPYNFNYGYEGFSYRFVQGPCPFDYFMCKSGSHKHTSSVNDRRCISKTWLCNNFISCNDESDEKYCPYDLKNGFNYTLMQDDCPKGFYRCKTGSPKNQPSSIENKNCIPKSWICDKKNDCNDKSDEKFCPYFFLPETRIETTTQMVKYLINKEESGQNVSLHETDHIVSTIQTIYFVFFIVTLLNVTIVFLLAIYICRSKKQLEYNHKLKTYPSDDL